MRIICKLNSGMLCTVPGGKNSSSPPPSDMPSNGMTSEESKVLLQEELDNKSNFSPNEASGNGAPPPTTTTASETKSNANVPRRVKLPIPTMSIPTVDDWCILDCLFGVPLFDNKLNSSICNAIVNEGLWLVERYVCSQFVRGFGLNRKHRVYGYFVCLFFSLEKLIEVNVNLSNRLTEFIKSQQVRFFLVV